MALGLFKLWFPAGILSNVTNHPTNQPLAERNHTVMLIESQIPLRMVNQMRGRLGVSNRSTSWIIELNGSERTWMEIYPGSIHHLCVCVYLRILSISVAIQLQFQNHLLSFIYYWWAVDDMRSHCQLNYHFAIKSAVSDALRMIYFETVLARANT